MTNRLKRKLGDLGVDPTSAKANESFCLIGTPLPPLEKSKDTGEFVPLWKQEVRDEKGRRRLHGAFTGGFSAGYFNSVGSKEGWTPQTFVSSRADRAKQKAARPEDFMDEEDLAELKERQHLVDTNEEMDLFGSAQNRRGGVDEPETDSIARTLESSMLPPPKDSIGARILKKMGWRMGQGIGPRITYRQRKLQDMDAMPGGAAATQIPEDDDEEAKKHMYAPRDTSILIVDRKDNSHGLGYLPGMGLNESLGVKNDGGVSGPKLAAGFGLGALNDAEDDDVDVYDGDFRKHGSRMAYDTSERHDDGDRIVIGGKGRNKPDARPSSSKGISTFHDGRSVLAGFILSDKPVAEDRWFAIPDIPDGWTPNPKRVWDAAQKDQGADGDAKKENKPPPLQSSSVQPHSKWKTGISAEERGALLGETPLPSAPRSVFEYMSRKDRERLQNISASASTPAPTTAPSSIVIPRTEPHIAQLALRGFQPFTSDPFKQSRYTAYLNSQSVATEPPSPAPGQSIDDFNKELEDYAKAAKIFKPLGGAMAGRFTSAVVADQRPGNSKGGLHIPTVEDDQKKQREKEERDEREGKKDEMEKREDESPKAHAARMGMYGRLTREVTTWIPAKLLCKRFGVKDPNPVLDPEPPPQSNVPTQSSGQPQALSAVEATAGGASGVTGDSATTTVDAKKRGGPRDLANIGLGEDDDQGRDTLTYQRPAMDIFKAIFASDDEDSGDDEAEGKEEEEIKDSIPEPSAPMPTPSSSSVIAGEKVDIASFKPTFIPRSDKPKKDVKKEKKEKKKKSGKTLVSFELDEEGGELSITPISKKEKEESRPKKKKKRKSSGGGVAGIGDEDDGMWVEKPTPEVVKSLPPPPEITALHNLDEDASEGRLGDSVMGPPRGRKRAIDFM